MGRIRYDLQRLSDLAGVYAGASADLFDGLDNAVTSARTLNAQQGDIHAALLAAVSFGKAGADVLGSGAPYLVRGMADLILASRPLDEYSPEFRCGIRNIAEVGPTALSFFGGNGYSFDTVTELLGAPNPYVYPDNLPRTNARGGPGGHRGAGRRSIATSGRPLPRGGHRRVDRPGQPSRTRVADPQRVRIGAPGGENTINP